jgi:LuxR family transcriptional regulator, positive regulator of biofilm formation
MNSIRISKINLSKEERHKREVNKDSLNSDTISKKEQVKTNAFLFTTSSNPTLETQQIKLNKFIQLAHSCEINITQSYDFPDKSLWPEFELYFIDLYHQQQAYDIPENILQLARCAKVVFFNVQSNILDESFALLAGITGIFYCHDRPDIILKGIENINDNGLWFKRSIMDKALMEFLQNTKPKNSSNYVPVFANPNKHQNKDLSILLTKREQTIVELVASGAQNKEIANLLHISPNTVKTHIYSIFRKTGSRNRIELVSWTQNLNLVPCGNKD